MHSPYKADGIPCGILPPEQLSPEMQSLFSLHHHSMLQLLLAEVVRPLVCTGCITAYFPYICSFGRTGKGSNQTKSLQVNVLLDAVVLFPSVLMVVLISWTVSF